MIDPPPELDQLRDRVSAAEEDAFEVDVDRLLPDLEGRVDRARVVRVHDPGVVVADVEAPEALDGLVEEGAHLVVVRDVPGQERSLAPHFLDEPNGLPTALLVHVGDDDLPAFASEEDGRSTAEAAARACDQAHLSVEQHGRLP